MMDNEEFENELSEDDEDFNPDAENDSVSENSGPDDDEPVSENDEDGASKPKKSKKAVKKRRGRASPEVEHVPEKQSVELSELTTEEMKRRADELFADFLNGTDDPPPLPKTQVTPASTVGRSETSTAASRSTPAAAKSSTITSKPIIPEAPAKIFEFAGETVEVPTKLPVQQESASSTTTVVPGVKRPGGGLASMLNQLSKKNKLSVLEKTKLDWDGFKSNQGISEELQSHNRGREGFLERRDFLERTDLRQFEIEKNMRLTRRK